jgi:hypothetical protein
MEFKIRYRYLIPNGEIKTEIFDIEQIESSFPLDIDYEELLSRDLFTGRYDADGNEIYAADILSRGGDNHNSFVGWDLNQVGFKCIEPKSRKAGDTFRRIHDFPPNTRPMHVIGNIHDNPKLVYRWGKS